MKKLTNLLALAATLLFPASCDKTPAEPSPDGDGRIRVEIGVTGSGTRVTGVVSDGESSEAKVNDLQIFVFNGGRLDGYGHGTGTKSLSVSCTAGNRDIYAVVNAPSLADIASPEALLGTVSDLSDDIANFQMIGFRTELLSEAKTITIPVDRLASRVVLRSIRNGFQNGAQPTSIKILSVCLTNVAGDVNLGRSEDYVAKTWYNRRGYQKANCLGSFNYDAVGTTLAPEKTYGTAHYFYSMPNAADPATGGPWTPRRAKLVVKAEIGGSVYDYPILLPVLKANHSYEIDLLTLTRPGNPDNGKEPTTDDDTDEEDVITGKDLTFTITVNPWNVVTVTEGTTI